MTTKRTTRATCLDSDSSGRIEVKKKLNRNDAIRGPSHE